LHANHEPSVVDVVERARHIHKESRHELLSFPRIVSVLDQACHGIHCAALLAATHLSGVKAPSRLTVIRNRFCRDLFNHLPQAV
jgi:hypothetical protein